MELWLCIVGLAEQCLHDRARGRVLWDQGCRRKTFPSVAPLLLYVDLHRALGSKARPAFANDKSPVMERLKECVAFRFCRFMPQLIKLGATVRSEVIPKAFQEIGKIILRVKDFPDHRVRKSNGQHDRILNTSDVSTRFLVIAVR